MNKQTKISRKTRRHVARKVPSLGEFKPQYNGKEPISFAEYIEGFKNEKLIPRRLRNHPLNKAVKA
ncbi:hypothetical protein [Lysinibacillus xylanilyticus]|uniref:hypothetical protein n=1 Tax=Lysinibacillus xylanilyticus TaxID=582475 RepID=UPI003D0876CD